MLCIAAVSKQLIQMFNEERKIFLSIYVNFVTWSRPAAHINILTTDYVEAMLKWYLIFILCWVVLLPQIVQLRSRQLEIWKSQTFSERVCCKNWMQTTFSAPLPDGDGLLGSSLITANKLCRQHQESGIRMRLVFLNSASAKLQFRHEKMCGNVLHSI